MQKYALLRHHKTELWMEMFREDQVWDHVMCEGTEWTKTYESAYESIMWSIGQEEQGPVWPVARIFDSYDSAKRVIIAEMKREPKHEDYMWDIVCVSASSELVSL